MFRPHRAVFRLLAGVVVGLLTSLPATTSWPWEARLLLGWNVFCIVNVLFLSRLLHASPEETRSFALRDDETRSVAALVTTTTALMSLIGVLFALHTASQEKGVMEGLLTALAVLTVALSWLLVHAEYTVHYARRYYLDNAGVEFVQVGSDEPLDAPAFLDFAYLSFTIGMTFQVSDTNLNTRTMRRLLLGHALISYVFSAVIVAVTINALAGLIG